MASAVGAANTLLFREGRTVADNTDAPGMVDVLRAAGLDNVRSVLIVGAGGTAQAVLGAVSMLQATPPAVTIAVREPARAAAVEDTAARLGVGARVRRLDACRG